MPEYQLNKGGRAAEFDALDLFTQAYITCAMWCGLGEDEQIEAFGEMDVATLDHLAPETWNAMVADSGQFCAGIPNGATLDAVDADPEHAGHDFWLTRNGHGAGFWDGDWPEPAATNLDNLSKCFGQVDLYVGDDGLIYAA